MAIWRGRDRAAEIKAEAEARMAAFRAKGREDLWNEVLRAAIRAEDTGHPVRCDLTMGGCYIVLTPK